MLFAAGFGLPSVWSKHRHAPVTPRQKFYAWIESRLLAPAQHVEPRLLDRFAEIEAESLFNIRHKRAASEADGRAMRAVIAKAIMDMPKLVQFRLPLTADTKRWLRLEEPHTVAAIAGHEFDACDVRTAIAAACGGQSVKCVSLDESVTFEFPPRTDALPSNRLYIRGPGLPEKATLTEPRY